MTVATRPVPILLYHGVSNCTDGPLCASTVRPAMFAEHMAYLCARNYTVVTVSQLAGWIAAGGAGLPARPVVLTFDDGYADFYTDALPVLARHGLAATLYIPTRWVAGTSQWLRRDGQRPRPLLTWPQLAEIAAAGIECGAHSHSHPQLDTLPSAAARVEVARCKEILERRLGRAVSTFAYPYGYLNESVRRLVREAGYTSACAVKLRLSSTSDDPLALARIMVDREVDVPRLAALLAGRGLHGATLRGRIGERVRGIARRCAVRFRRRLRGGTN